MDDLKIIESCLIGKTDIFSKLIDKYKNMVYDLAYRMTNNAHEAEDISQEAFLRSYQALSRFNPKYKFSTWLYQVTLNIIRDKLKKKTIAYITLVAFALILFAIVGTSIFCGTGHNFAGSDVETSEQGK